MFKHELAQLGLSEEEATVYEALLTSKAIPASALLAKTPYKRGNLYNILADLEVKGLVIRSEKAKNATFEAAHPNKVLELLEAKDQLIHKARATLEAAMPQMLSTYNMTHSKPGVRFFEGEQGVKTAAYDSLTAKGEILSTVDLAALQGHKILESDYGKKRDKLNIKKRLITLDIPFAYQDAKDYNWENTDVRLIDHKYSLHYTIMQIYNNKVSYITLEKGKQIAIIIEDENIANMHRTMFEIMWANGKEIPHDQPKQRLNQAPSQ